MRYELSHVKRDPKRNGYTFKGSTSDMEISVCLLIGCSGVGKGFKESN